MYKEIDENEEQKKYTEVVNKITPESLGLRPTNDFAEYAQQTIIDENPDKVKEWVGKGAINVMEAGKRYASEFDGTYGNIDPAANLNRVEKALHNSGINNIVDERINKRAKAKAERNKRVNNGTASILDRIGAGLDRWGNASYQAQVKGAEQQEASQMPHKNDPNYKYKPVGSDITGRVIYNETDLRKKIDFSEALADSIGKGKALPFISGLVEGSSAKKYRDIAERIRNGEAIRQDELDFVNRYNENLNEEYIRGYTIGGQIGSSILPSLLAFGSEMALGGAVLGRLGLKGVGVASGTNLGKSLLRSGKVSKKMAKAIAFTTGQLAEGGITAGVTSAVNPSRIFATYQERRLNDEMKITDRGTVIFSEAKESPAKAFVKSLGQVYISYFTENMGALLGSPLKAGGNAIKNIGAQQFAKVIEKNPVLEKLIQRTAPIFAKAYEKLNNLPIKGKSVEWLKGQVKFDGFIEELGEEVLEDILNLTFGTDDEERTLENYVSKIVKSPEEWAVLAGVIALQGTMLSIAGNTLGDYMHTNGVEFEDIARVLTNSTEAEKIEYINEAIKRGDIKINEGAIQDNQGLVSNLKNKYYTQIKNAGIEDTEALQTADLFSQVIATTANKFDMSIEDTDRLMGLNIQSMTDEQAKAQQQADIKAQQENIEKHNQPLYQSVDSAGAENNEIKTAQKEWQEKGTESKYFKKWFGDSKVVDDNGEPLVVYHGGNIFDVFDYDKIGINGTAEGVGFYFTDNKETAEGYTKRNGELKECYLSIKKPLTYDSHYLSYNDVKNIIKKTAELQAEEYEEDIKDGFISNYADTYSLDIDNAVEMTADMIYSEDKTDIDMLGELAYSAGDEFANRATVLTTGYDGIVSNGFANERKGGGTFYIAFTPEQIKSVNNQGTFDTENPNIYYQIAYNGSPNNFDQFSTDYIGSGEGNQSHGWGLYFAENRETAERYRNRLKGIEESTLEGAKKIINQLNECLKFARNKKFKISDTALDLYNSMEYRYENKNDFIADLQDSIAEQKKHIKQIEHTLKKNGNNKSQVYKVDIPKSDVLLDEDLSLNKQPEKVRKIIFNYMKDNPDDFILPKDYNSLPQMRGHHFYREVALIERKKGAIGNGDKEASLSLNEYGIKGITYDGQQDGRCYVVFDDKAINVLETYYQSENEQGGIDNARGFTYQRFNFDGTTKDNLIVLLKGKANKSTLLHEFAHVYLITLNNLARENAKARDLLIKVNKFLNYNGVEYTTAQHEKFANSFVAYVRTGKAPTYGLKKVFENFKKWLNDLYSSLQLSDEIELSQEAKDVFDELLGDMTLDVQKKISLDIIKKAKENALLRFWDDEAGNRNIPQNQLTDRQRRYRDTAYDILWYALSHTKNEEGKQLVKDKRQLYMLLGNDSKVNRKNKGVMSQSEKLKSILSELDDAFSGNDGFLPEWAEFFNDPGVSSQNDEMADSELALMALDVIENKKYLYDAENVYEELSVNDVKMAELELDYIIQRYAEEGTDKSNVVVAFFEWIDNQHPYIQEDLISKWELKTNEIDRYQSLNKFEQAKEDLKLYAATLKGHGDYSWQFAEYARAILKRLDFMTERDKEKIFSKLKEYNSFREVERNLDYVMDYAQTLDDVTLRRNIADTIISEIKHTTPEIKNGTKKTRYDYKTNKLFERLRYLNKLSHDEITDLYDAYVNNEIERRSEQFDENGTISAKVETYFEDIENSFLQFKANGMYYNSTEMLQTLLEKIQNAKFTGKLARDEMDFERQMNQKNWIDNCAKAVESHKGKVGKTEELYSMEANFDSLLSMIFDDKIKNKFSLDDLYAQVDGRVGKDREEVLNKIADVFGFQGVMKGALLNNKFIEMVNDKFTIKQRYANKYQTDTSGVWNWEDITLSRMEVLYYYIQSKNPTSYAMLTDMGDENTAPKGQFDKFEFDQLINKLTDQEKLMGDILQTAAEKYYNDLNKYHIKKHHIDMGKVTCYFPRKSEMKEINELDLFNQYTEKSTNPKFVKMRSAGPSVRIAPANPINVLFNHIQKANTIIIMGDQLDLMNKVFRDNDLKQKIKSVFGDKVYMEFMQHVTENLYSGQTATLSNAEGIISKIMSNVIAAPMLIKPQIGIKQVMGLINYGVGDEHVSTLEWLKAFGKVIKNPKAAIDFMMKDEYLKDRLTRANLNEAMKNQVDNKLFSKMSLLTDYFSLNMRLGDLFNLTLGGRAYVQVLLDKGYTKEQAFELFRRKTIADQQSSIPSTLSNLQRNSKNNPFARLLFAYQNTPHQYFRICANAVIKAKQGKMSKTQAAKTIFIYWWFLPFIFNMAGSLSLITFLTTGDPDEIYNDMLIACLGSITCIPFFGEMARAIFSGITGQEYFGNKDWFTRANESIVKPIKKARKGDLTFEDVIKSLEILAQGFGIPLEEIDTQIEAVGDYAKGDIAKGFLKTLGYSRYRAKKLTGEEKE